MIRSFVEDNLREELRMRRYKLTRKRSFDEDYLDNVFESPKGIFSLRNFQEKRCIFVHIPKTGGMSLASGLFGEFPYHYPAWQYRIIYGSRLFDEYFKFAIVRNPWDRLYSAYSFLESGGWNRDDARFFDENLARYDGFNDFVSRWLNETNIYSYIHFAPQHHFVFSRKGSLQIDHLGYFESLGDEYSYVADRLGVDDRTLPHLNKTDRKHGYRQAYNDTSIAKVSDLYGEDVSLFGYEFDHVERRTVVNGGLRPAGSTHR